MSWVMAPDRLPRDVLPPEGEAGEVEWTLQLDNNAPAVKATFNARNYRRMLKEVDANPASVMVALQGYLTGGPNGLYLEKAGFRVDKKMARPAGGPPPSGGPRPSGPRPSAPRPSAPRASTPGPVVESVRRLK
ncbi:MAG: hypothetical protein QM765_39515 [Myxococcales bacterium]